MTPFECLTEKEKEAIQYRFDYYTSSELDIGCKQAPLNHILRFWNTNKEDIFHKFGDKLIVERNFEYTKSYDEIIETMSSEDYRAITDFPATCYKFLVDLKHQYDKDFDFSAVKCKIYNKVAGWVGKDRFWEIDRVFYQVFSITQLIRNKVNLKGSSAYNPDNRYFIELADGKDIEIYDGMKITKLLKKIADSYGIPGYEEYRLAQSMAINQRTVTGTLCLSIHPLDFITMSDNNSGWSSCMSWEHEGEYRQGTVEMMNSPCVIVAYLKSDTKKYEIMNHFNWSNKKWRLLIIAANDRIVSIKSYPYFNEVLTTEALNFTKELLDKDNAWDETLYRFEGNYLKGNSVELSKEYPIFSRPSFSTNVMYNDFGLTIHFGYVRDKGATRLPGLNYSGPAECMKCGADLSYLSFKGTEFCLRCNPGEIFYCCNCDDSLTEDEVYVGPDNEYYCEHCFNKYFAYDMFTANAIDKSFSNTVKILDDEGAVMCRGFADDVERFCTELSFEDDICIYAKHLTPKGWRSLYHNYYCCTEYCPAIFNENYNRYKELGLI